mmetsp:Transcript_3052/g.7160  ORF Transcript_3052/g.7160 Transcript_3052/m.7160 type:complete len:106 (+) Transcript_3052:77-394(+)|eukprot:CAMPEP_0113605430 /NCGR_PEP_ID=MMETSP0017_2-20120614/2324_1 /TAXON_ID=2856 /ORGANISM="Cylindrotheca closterium" /LENGTH=105 /DNA_ID=CAMNT_0000513921 /DNA_START=72 /DNA_END=389 /DNA_ORIENTATION=- /assembly_acc=CAM_ASM_000147
MVSRNLILATIVVVASIMLPMTAAFAPQASVATPRASPLYIFGGKKQQEDDFSDIEVRDMTREEMLEMNRKNEDVMNMELGMMTAFGLFTSIPMLYLCWVAFFSD